MDIQPERIFNTLLGFAESQALSLAVELDLFTAIHERASTVEKVARELGLPLRSARILLDALVGMGFLTKSKISYKLPPESKTFLVKSEPHYLGSMASPTTFNLDAWKKLGEVVRTGKPIPPPSNDPTGEKFFTQLAKNIFPMSYASAILAVRKLGVGKTLKSMKILDVACGSGAWSIAFSLADANSQTTAQDLPEVLDLTRQYVRRFRLDKQYNYLPGDLQKLELGRSKYDLIILGHICHSLGELESRRLLKKSFDALRPNGRLFIAEFIPNDLRTGEKWPLLFALQMLLATPHGDVFTLKEFKRWLALAGFKKVSALKLVYPTSAVVAVK